jgi:hypothetical protein
MIATTYTGNNMMIVGSIGSNLMSTANLHVANTISSSVLLASGITATNINFTGNLFQNGTIFTGSATSQWTTGTGGNIFYTGGNVGIGTTAPSFTLDVVGGARFTTGITTGTVNVVSAGSFSTLTGASVSLSGSIGSSIITTGQLGANNATVTSLVANINVTTTTMIATTYTGGNMMIVGSIGTAAITTGQVNAPSSTITNIVHTNISTTTLIVSAGGLNATFNTNTIGSLFTTGGNVGISTTAPNSRLTIVANSPSANIETSINGIQILSSNGYTTATMYMGADATNDISWIQSTKTGTFTSMSLSPRGGNVGVGTTSPSTRLDVNGTFRATTSVTTGTLNATNSTITNIVGTNISTAALSIGVGQAFFGTTLGSSKVNIRDVNNSLISFYYSDTNVGNITCSGGNTGIFFNGAGSSSQFQLTLDSRGNVGVNTSNPSSTFDVTGSIRTSLGITAGATLISNASLIVSSGNITVLSGTVGSTAISTGTIFAATGSIGNMTITNETVGSSTIGGLMVTGNASVGSTLFAAGLTVNGYNLSAITGLTVIGSFTGTGNYTTGNISIGRTMANTDYKLSGVLQTTSTAANVYIVTFNSMTTTTFNASIVRVDSLFSGWTDPNLELSWIIYP